MQIERMVNKKIRTFELTTEELYSAFIAQENLFFREDLETELEDYDEYSEEEQKRIMENDELVSDIRDKYEKSQECSPFSCSEHMYYAISECAEDIKAFLEGSKEIR